jgi:hypothetical protein
MASLRSALPIAILTYYSPHLSAHMSVILVRSPIQRCCPEDCISRRMQLSRGAIQSNCEHRTRRAHDGRTKTGIAEHDWRFAVRGLQRTYPAPSGFGRCLIEHCPSVPHDCDPRRYNVFERSLGGLLKLASQDSNRSLGRFLFVCCPRRKTLPNPFKIPGAARS